MDNFDSEFWSKFDQEAQLKSKLEEGFDDYQFILGLKSFITLIISSKNQLQELKYSKIDHPNTKNLLSIYDRMNVLYFAVYSTQLSLENFLYKSVEGLRNDKADYINIIDSWKKSTEVQVVKFVRNRFQHGAWLKPSFNYNVKISEEKETQSEVRVTDEDLWGKLENNLKSRAEDLLGDQEDKIFHLTKLYCENSTKNANLLIAAFEKNYSSEMTKRQGIIKQLDAIETFFSSKGLTSNFPNKPVEPDI